MDNENILTTAGILIIYEDGTYTLVPKMKDYEYHVHYINHEICVNQNIKLSEMLKNCKIEEVLNMPSEFSKVINELTLNGNILLTNFACNYMGPTNYFGAYLPKRITDKQKETIKELELYIKELEFDHIAVYNEDYKRCKVNSSVDLLDFIEKKK